MKRFFVTFFILALGIFLTPNFYSVSADIIDNDDLGIKTIYTDDILEYQNIDGISKLAVGKNYIAYSLDNQNIKVFNINSKEYKDISCSGTISKLEIALDNLLIASNAGVKAVNLNTLEPTALDIESNRNIVDFYVDDSTIYVGYINDNSFKLTEYYLNLIIKEQTRTIYTDTESKLSDAQALALNDTTAYILCGSSSKTLYKLDFTSSISPKTLTEAITTIPFKIIDTFYYDNVPYVIAFTSECLYLYNNSLVEICNTTNDPISKDQLHISDFDFYNNKIYIADNRTSKNIAESSGYIQEYSIETERNEVSGKIETKFSSTRTLICSKSSETGRFNEASGLMVSGDTILVADSKNNSIHLINKNGSKFTTTNLSTGNIENLKSLGNLILDKDLNLYVVANYMSGSSILKFNYNKEHNSYNYADSFDSVSTQKIGFISSISAYQNTIYALDYTQNKLLVVSKDILQESNLDSSITLTSTSKISCLKSSENIVIHNNDTIYLTNSVGRVLDSVSTPNFISITTDYTKVYGIYDNKIYSYSITNQTITDDSNIIDSNKLSNINLIHFDIATRKMYGFNKSRGCLVTFDFSTDNAPFALNNIDTPTPLTNESMILPIELKNSPIIYEFPNLVGTPYNKDGSVTNAIGIEDFGNEYRILFNNNGKLTSGFISKTSALTKENNCDDFYKVITINKKVPIYKYPTLLRINNDIVKVGELELKTSIYVKSDKFPISIDDKYFYEYEDDNGNIGYIFHADIVSDDSKNISYIESNNATIKIIGADNVIVYADDKEEELLTLKNSTRIYVEEYSSDSEYTKIKYIDSNQKTTIGYVKTEYIEMDKLDNTKIVLIIVIILSVILLNVITISYIAIKKKKK